MTAVYAGTFDPVTFGHIDIIRRAATIFDSLYVVVGVNPDKVPLFSEENRAQMLNESLSCFRNVKVVVWRGMTVDFARDKGAKILVRGIRDASDLNYELQMADFNRSRLSDCEVIFLPADQRYSGISSSLVRKRAQEGLSISEYVPANVESALKNKFHLQ